MTTSQHVPDGYDVCRVCGRVCPKVQEILDNEAQKAYARLTANKGE